MQIVNANSNLLAINTRYRTSELKYRALLFKKVQLSYRDVRCASVRKGQSNASRCRCVAFCVPLLFTSLSWRRACSSMVSKPDFCRLCGGLYVDKAVDDCSSLIAPFETSSEALLLPSS